MGDKMNGTKGDSPGQTENVPFVPQSVSHGRDKVMKEIAPGDPALAVLDMGAVAQRNSLIVL